MVHRSMQNLKLDKRLSGRPGWIDQAERESALAALPDVQDKAERFEVEPESESSPEGEASSSEGEASEDEAGASPLG